MRFDLRIEAAEKEIREKIEKVLPTYGLKYEPRHTEKRNELKKMFYDGMFDKLAKGDPVERKKLLKKYTRKWIALIFYSYHGEMKIANKQIFLEKSGKDTKVFEGLPAVLWEDIRFSFDVRLSVCATQNVAITIRDFLMSKTEETVEYKNNLKKQFSKEQQIRFKFSPQKENEFLKETTLELIYKIKEWLEQGKAMQSLRKELIGLFQEKIEETLLEYKKLWT